MPKDLKSLREERAKLIHDARGIVDTIDTEKRAATDEETKRFDDMMAAADKLKGDIDRREALQEQERALEESRAADDREERANGNDRDNAADTVMQAFRSWLGTGQANGEGAAEFRALSAGTNTEGGYLVAPEQFVASLIKDIDDDVVMRRLGTVYALGASQSLGIPTLDADPADADWTTELQTGSEDSTMAFGKREMRPHPVAKRIKVSQTLLRTAVLPAEQIVRERLAYKFGITQEKAYLTGNGNQQPLGVFTASADGIPTARDVATGNTAALIKADGLMEAKYSLKAQYQRTATWLFHRDGVKQVAKLKDGEGQYIWQPGLVAGSPDMLLGRPVEQSEYAPNTFTTGQYVGLFGDFSHYWIVDSLVLAMQRLNELYSETNQIGFIGRYEGDGAPTLAEAFARVKLG